MSIEKQSFGCIVTDGVEEEIFSYTLRNANGMRAKILSFGGAIAELWVPDRNGDLADIVGGYDSLASYVYGDGYQGALIGRFGNRIAKGQFTLNGKDYTLAVNNGVNHLHGGDFGFSHKVWDVCEKDGDEPELILHRLSPDGEEGYPGNLDVTVTYRLTRQNGLVLHYRATTDEDTVVNLTNHTYFHLNGFSAGSIRSMRLTLDADRYLPTDDTLIPTGELCSVEGTPFDFRTPKTIGKDLGSDHPDVLCAGGYDHCFVFSERLKKEIVKRGELYDAESGRRMELYTDQPCVQFYTGNFLKNAKFPFKGNYPQKPQTLLCLETEHMPDSIHHANFTDTVLRPGEVYDFTTEYRFGTDS